MKYLPQCPFLLVMILIISLLTCGCQTTPDKKKTAGNETPKEYPAHTGTEKMLWQTTITAPAREVEVADHRIGKCVDQNEAGGLYLVSDDEQTGILITDKAEYSFNVVNTNGKPLRLFLTDWNRTRTMEIYNTTKDNTPLKFVDLEEGKYYVWAIHEGPYAVQVV
jgi:hypothetical protein